MPEHLVYFSKAFTAIALAGITWLADLSASSIDAIPAMVSEFGLPIVFLTLTIYALIYTTKALRAAEAGRLQDRADYTASIRADAERAEASRERLRESMDKQSAAVERMGDKIELLVNLHQHHDR